MDTKARMVTISGVKESFSDKDIIVLLNLLTGKLNLNCSVHKLGISQEFILNQVL